MIAPKSRHDAPATAPRGSVVSCAVDRLLDRVGERRVVGDQDRLRRGVVLGLRQQVGGDPVGIAALVGEDQHLGRAGDHVDADRAEHQALGRRHIGVAGADDLGDRRDRRRAVGERRDRLRAADAIDLVDAGELRRRQHQRVELAVRRRHHHDDARHARDLGRHGVHQHRRRIGRGAARHVEPDRLDRGPAVAELDAERIGEAVVLRHLAAVIGLDAVARELERVERAAVAGRGRGVELGCGDAQADLVEIDAVEFPGELDQRAVAVAAHVGDDGAHRLLDVRGRLALGGEKRGKARGKVRGAAVEADRHRALSGREEPRLHRSMARAGRRVNPVWMRLRRRSAARQARHRRCAPGSIR